MVWFGQAFRHHMDTHGGKLMRAVFRDKRWNESGVHFRCFVMRDGRTVQCTYVCMKYDRALNKSQHIDLRQILC